LLSDLDRRPRLRVRREELRLAGEQALLKLYSLNRLPMIRTLFESEAWTATRLRTDAHPEVLTAAAMPMSDSASKHLMARLETRSRNDKFEILQTPGVLQRPQNALGGEKP
jgi:hypothetical protein